MELLSILDGTLDRDFIHDAIGGYDGNARQCLWEEIRDQQSSDLIDVKDLPIENTCGDKL